MAQDWVDVDWIRGEVMITKAMTQAAKGVAEILKTAAGRRAVKLLGGAMAVLKTQKDHTYLAGRGIPKSVQARALGWGWAYPKNAVAARGKEGKLSVPAALPDASHVRLDGALRR